MITSFNKERYRIEVNYLSKKSAIVKVYKKYKSLRHPALPCTIFSKTEIVQTLFKRNLQTKINKTIQQIIKEFERYPDI